MRERLPKQLLFQCIVWLSMCTIHSGVQSQTHSLLPNIMAPEVASLGKFGAYPVSYYTGSANVSIPLYSIKGADINMDLSLQYDGSGFIPNKESGTVGLNWSLMAGGVVTRIVNWAPDDRLSSSIAGYNLQTYKGYIYGMLNANLGKYDKEYIRKLSFLHISDQLMPTTDLKYEYAPDVFSFNFNGHAGKFFLGNDGEVKVVADQKYKVSLAKLATQSDDMCQQCQSSEIAITTEDGDTYTFGGDINTLEISYSYADNNSKEINCSGSSISAWHLTSIKTKNGNVVTFKYEPQSKSALSFARHRGLNADIDYAYEKIFFNEAIGTFFNGGGQSGVNTVGEKNRCLIKTAYLSSITTAGSIIELQYIKRNNNLYPAAENVLNPNRSKQLDRIIVKNTEGKLIKSLRLDYVEYGSNAVGYRQFLNKVIDISTTNPNDSLYYQLDYYKTDNLPDPLTKGIDVSGFYNGQSNSSLIPNVSTGAPNYDVDLSTRKANPAYCDMGLLKTITFPTGGWTTFVYEGHDYGKVLRKRVTSGMTAQWFSETGYTGGARIKQIIESSGVKRTFKYVKDYSSKATGSVSSGILTDNDIFYLDCQYYYNDKNPNVREALIKDNNIAPSASYGESPIGYSEVTELTDEGYTRYFYTTKETNPDKYHLGNDSYKTTPDTDNSFTNFLQQVKRLVKYSSCDIERGKVLSTQVYNKDDQLLKKTVNRYNEDSLRYNESVIGFNFPYINAPGYAIYHSYALYYFQNNVKQQQIFDYGMNGTPALTQTINYKYASNSNSALTEKTEISSEPDTLTSRYKYAADFTASPVYSAMVQQNYTSPVIEQTAYKNGALLHTITNTFKKLNNNIIAPDSVKTKRNGFAEGIETVYNTYDSLGNVLQYSTKSKSTSGFIWDYKPAYPTAEYINAVSTDVAATSFEADGKGGFTFSGTPVIDATAPTGKKVYSLSGGSISKSGLNAAKTFIVSYWSKSGVQSVNGTTGTVGYNKNGWTLYTHEVVKPAGGTITLSGVGTIDELRLYPKEAKLITYTYEPLRGISSRNDGVNSINYYKYDGFGRLRYIVDMDKRLVKKICYNYAGQPESCSAATLYYNQQLSQAFTKNNCLVDSAGTTVTYIVPAGTYISEISQADANAQAQADIAANGQNYANANGKCVFACSATNCTGTDKKCINNTCETGIRVNTATTKMRIGEKWSCTYHYEWSDGSRSPNYTDYNPFPCDL